jgi:hypothetical protein
MQANPHSINSVALAAFEKQLAQKLSLTREKDSLPPMAKIDSKT